MLAYIDNNSANTKSISNGRYLSKVIYFYIYIWGCIYIYIFIYLN